MAYAVSPTSDERYIVVARRYRPQRFDALIGQDSLVRTLCNAIESDRVGHAYLFTGSRGVGKTSAARIFAKAMNCEQGPTIQPCNSCDSCLAVSLGEDIDVLEIDGASNRGIDEIRQLRANVGVRPSRARNKIYIIDEVHMLSRDAFNALLKTLEEPPAHVKFIFCTTDVDKVPITVLSRCQRFDFAPISMADIQRRLQEIVEGEGASAEPDALELLARRAEGSLRDSQSLLEQVLASVEGPVTPAVIHRLLGTAPEEHVRSVVESLLERDAKQAIEQLDAAVAQGVDVGQFCEQLLTMLRDTMVAGVGCSREYLLSLHAEQYETLQDWSGRWGLPTVVNALQILEHCLSRMRWSVHRRSLLEIALVQLANLQALTNVAELAAELGTGAASNARAAASDPAKKKAADRTVQNSAAAAVVAAKTSPSIALRSEPQGEPDNHQLGERLTLATETAAEIWRQVVSKLGGTTATAAANHRHVEFQSPNQLVVVLGSEFHRQRCDRPEARQSLGGCFAGSRNRLRPARVQN